MSTNETTATFAPGKPVPRLTLGWALRRAMLGLLILFVMFGGGAWLLYSTIEPDRADASETAESSRVPAAATRTSDLR
jgi:zona occludens toxin (predicted ATPase)